MAFPMRLTASERPGVLPLSNTSTPKQKLPFGPSNQVELPRTLTYDDEVAVNRTDPFTVTLAQEKMKCHDDDEKPESL